MHGEVWIEWCIAWLYMLTAYFSWQRWRYSKLQPKLGPEGCFWLLLAAVLVIFGINKIADLQTVLLASLKSLALSLNLAEAKLTLKVALAGAILGGSLLSATWLVWRFRNVFRLYPLTLLGLAGLASYYLARAADFLGFALPMPLAAGTWGLEAVGLVILQVVVGRPQAESVAQAESMAPREKQ